MNRKRILWSLVSLLVTLSLVVPLSSGLVRASPATEIEDWHDLHDIRDDLSGDYVLMNDLDENTAGYGDYNTGAGWEPIGTSGNRFTGSFDGNGHTISNLFIDRDDMEHVGLFGYVHGDGTIIENVRLEHVNVTGHREVGGLVGSVDYDPGLVTIENVDMVDVTVTGYQEVGGLIGEIYGYAAIENVELVDVNVTADRDLGGLAGDAGGAIIENARLENVNVTGRRDMGGLTYINRGTISNSYVTGIVSGDESTVGGLVGLNRGTISHSHTDVTVTSADSRPVGGLVATNRDTISHSSSAGEVSGIDRRVGGLVGWNTLGGAILYSHSSARVTGHMNVGGLVGENRGESSVEHSYATGNVIGDRNVGGLVGYNYLRDRPTNGGGPTVKHSYATGDVTVNERRAGGLVGSHRFATISNSYATGSVTRTSGTNASLGGLVGHTYDSTIEHAYNTGSVYYDNADDPTDKGFVGTESGDNTYIANFFDSETSNQDADAVGAADPKTTAEMKQIATFSADWDIALTDTELNDGYPFLAWQDDRDDVVWLITETPLFCGGEGTEADPYLICTADELNNVRYHLGAYFKLNNDIDLDTAPFNSDAGWEPIGDDTTPFTGQLDGAGFEIRNLFINRPTEDRVGLFGRTETGAAVPGATVIDLDLVDVNVTGNGNVGALAGRARDGLRVDGVSVTGTVVAEGSRAGCLAGTLRSDSVVENTHVAGNLISNDTGNVRIGGFAGELEDDAVIINSHSAATVTSVNDGNYVGGFIGEMEENAQIIGSHFSGTVSGGRRVGGLAGQAQSDNLIIDSWSTGAVSGEDEVGGLVGDLSSTSSIIASYATGEVTATGECVGGLVGLARRNSSVTDSYAQGQVSGGQYAGGLVGCARDDATIATSYATGAVSGSDTGGLLALLEDNAAVTNSCYDRNTSGQDDDDGRGVPKTTAEMKDIDTFSGANWDIETTSAADPTDGYPFLAWQLGSSPTWYIYLDERTKSVETATDTGTAYFTPEHGFIEDLEAIEPPAAPPPPGVDLPHGMFSFEVTGLTPGETVTVTIELPRPVEPDFVWWKYDENTDKWYDLEISIVDDYTMQLELTDGEFPGDLSGVADGTIVDPGGPGNPEAPPVIPPVGGTGYPVSRLAILAPWIALLAAIAGASLLMLRRRRAQIQV